MDLLKYYSNSKVQEALLGISMNREVVPKFNESFGKRPDAIQFESDILEMVKKGATSFHLSEEHWSNPLLLKSGMTKSQLDILRTRWDLILDIDGPFEFSMIAADLIREALQFHDVENFTVKFSGNKGFHIAIPSNAFPESVDNKKTKDLFPEAPKVIASYLKEMIKENLMANILKRYEIDKILEITKKQKEDLLYKICKKCERQIEEKIKCSYECKRCGSKELSDVDDYSKCPECKNERERNKIKTIECSCGNKKDFESGKFNPFSIVDIDTILISSRHLFRAPYSYHEKSGLISIPVRKNNILNFDRESAKMENVSFNEKFLAGCNDNEASRLIIQAFDWNKRLPQRELEIKKQYPEVTKKISMDLFPSSIKKGLLGLEDGRKRFLFVLLNFLKSLNYENNEIDKIIHEWNMKNKEQLKEGYIRSQLLWHGRQGKILPPNFSNKAYYDDIGLKPGENELKFKNPINYSLSLFRAKRR